MASTQNVIAGMQVLMPYYEESIDLNFDWDLYLSISRFILPKLRYFRENNARFPDRMNLEEWQKKMDMMIVAFELIDADGPETPEQKQAIEKGLKEFARYFQELWY